MTLGMFQDAIRHKMFLFSQLLEKGEVTWFYFLYHDKADDPDNGYFDVVFATDRKDPDKFLPKYCVSTKKISPMTKISGIDLTILRDDSIAEAWRIIGEQPELVIKLVRAHKENKVISHFQIAQFMHYFMNAFGLGTMSILFFPELPSSVISQIQSMPKEVAKYYVRF